MKLMTLNLHCFAEKEIADNQRRIAEMIDSLDVDVIFLQEVAQHKDNPIVTDNIKEGNYGYTLQQLLQQKGTEYDYHYMYGNLAFRVFEEGLGILSKTSLHNKKHFFVSKDVNYHDWHTRVIVKADTLIDGNEYTLCSSHLGWTEGDEKFEDQIDLLFKELKDRDYFLGGDFNVGSTSKQYEYIVGKGAVDLYYQGDEEHFTDPTHITDLDVHTGENRIDYIFGSKGFKVIDRKILFKENRVSDHYGVYIEIEVE